MEKMYKVHSIIMEASSKEDQQYMKTMNKNDVHQANGTLIQELYEVVMKRKDVDFGDIPASAGDIEKVKYYESTVQSLDILDDLYRKNMISEPALPAVRKAISNMKQFRPQFITGFKMKHEFIMIMYNSLVMAIIDATASLIGSYLDFIVSSDTNYTVNHKASKMRGSVALDNLYNFNTACENGSMSQAMTYMIKEQRSAFIGIDDAIITGVAIAGLLSIVPITRELIYFYYSSRVKLSDYLEMQAELLEMNKRAVSSSNRSASEKKAIVKKQEDTIKKMRRLSDKLTINNVDTADVIKKEIKNENALWTLPNVEKKIAYNKLNNTGLNIM